MLFSDYVIINWSAKCPHYGVYDIEAARIDKAGRRKDDKTALDDVCRRAAGRKFCPSNELKSTKADRSRRPSLIH